MRSVVSHGEDDVGYNVPAEVVLDSVAVRILCVFAIDFLEERVSCLTCRSTDLDPAFCILVSGVGLVV